MKRKLVAGRAKIALENKPQAREGTETEISILEFVMTLTTTMLKMVRAITHIKVGESRSDSFVFMAALISVSSS